MEIFPYSWNVYEEYGYIGIRIFGLNKHNESVFLFINDFRPYLYLELPYVQNLNWTQARSKIDSISAKIDEVCGKFKPIEKKFELKKKLYYAKKDITEDGSYKDKLYPFLKCFFKCSTDLKQFSYKMRMPLVVGGVGKINLKTHESEANPILQFMCMKNIKPAGWFKFIGRKIDNEDDKQSACQHEYTVSWKNFIPIEKNAVASPLIMGFDIEVNSSNPNVTPQSNLHEDKIFQISCVVCRNGDKEDSYKKYILTLSMNKKGEQVDLIPEKVGEDVEIRMFNNESELLMGFNEIINEINPQILCGYNIFGFDLPYISKRAQLNAITSMFDQLSFIKGVHSKEVKIEWSSSAFKNQNFTYLDAPGRLWIDMLPIIQRDYKLENYKLKTVSDTFLGQTKDPLTHKGIFKCYRMFTPDSLSIVAKYCVKDSELVVKLFEKLQIWIGLTEMANTCNTPIFTLFTQGQQIKIFSQVYKKCMEDNIVIDKDSFVTNENDHFTGAYVFTPIPGLYDMVVSFDFSSLYPSTIIAYNIDYSTLVLDEKIPDEKCHIFEWEDHFNCECPESKKVKTKKVVICKKNIFRFLKEPMGIIPTLLTNLIDARKKAKKEMERLQSTVDELKAEEQEQTKRLITVLDKRQLAYKISANSMYGGMGVKRGYLPFLPGAMCTTARGRQSIEKASKFLVENYGAKLIYGDTDSCYISFPQFTTEKDAKDLDSFCRKVEEETSGLFPRPMKFAYEEAIYWRYLILSKKRYMALKCDTDGKIKDKIEKRGVLLSRRDNSSFSRDFYSKLIMKTFYKESFETSLHIINEQLSRLYNPIIPDEKSRLIPETLSAKELSISKSIGDIKDYKIKPLPEDRNLCIGCKIDVAVYNTKDSSSGSFPGGKDNSPSYCYKCKKEDMVDTRKKCIKCENNLAFLIKNIPRPRVRSKIDQEPLYCYKCKGDDNDMIDIVHKKLQKRLSDLKLLDLDADLNMVKKIFKDVIERNEEEIEDHRFENQLEFQIVTEYINKCLPSHIQLAQKMRRRGNLLSAGERLAYVVVESENKKDKLFEKIEDLDYFRENINYITIDQLYYTRLMINPIDEVIKAVYGKSDVFKNIYKQRENYIKVINQLNEVFSPRITLLE
jgi:DNA polymerase elongation subunit (family B)